LRPFVVKIQNSFPRFSGPIAASKINAKKITKAKRASAFA
jgi:hypothetical protein